MNMPVIAIAFGILLDLLGTAGFVATGMQHKTSLIPCAFGGVLLISGVIALTNAGLRKHLMHLSAAVGLFGALGGLGMSLPKLLKGAELARPMATWMQLAMGVLCLVFVGLCVKSFRDARKAREAAGA